MNKRGFVLKNLYIRILKVIYYIKTILEVHKKGIL